MAEAEADRRMVQVTQADQVLAEMVHKEAHLHRQHQVPLILDLVEAQCVEMMLLRLEVVARAL